MIASRQELAAASDASDAGLLDVVANMLMVLILATLAILVVAAPPQEQGEVVGETNPALSAPVPLFPDLKPLVSIWLVGADGAQPLDLDEVVAAFEGGAKRVDLPIGKASFDVLPVGFRDFNEYQLKITLDEPHIAQTGQFITPLEATDEIVRDFESEATHPVLVVMNGGHQTMASLYFGLREKGVPLKWFPYPPQQGLTLLRNAATSSTRLETWQ